jgi:hypothetical protein
MKYLYIDNFRGFSKATIPIRDVNFLVGQNSTGKTSMLGLLKLLSSPRFLFEQEFSDEHVSFGHFSDMVSAHSKDRSYFHIGLVWDETEPKKNTKVAVGWLLTYREADGIPRLERYTLCRGTQSVSLRFKRSSVFFKRCDHEQPQNLKELVTRLPDWTAEHCSDDAAGYKKLAIPGVFRSRIPLLVALSLSWKDRGESSRKRTKAKNQGEFILQSPDEISFAPDLAWVAPIRTKPKTTYGELPLEFSPEGEHTPYLIRRILRSKANAAKFHAFMERVGKASGLFQDVTIKQFGSKPGNPFELDVVLDDEALKLTTVGYGVSQALPVLVEILIREEGSWFAIQQPEVHLHPRAQAVLGDMVFEMAVIDRKRFLIETHSDFMIDRFRMNYRTARKSKPDAQILFFERKNKCNTVTPIVLEKTGELPIDQPDSYREFFIREQMNLLGI